MELIYLALPSVGLSKLRVAERVAHGGHDIQLSDLARRFPRSLRNLLNEFSFAADRTQCFMNDAELPQLIFEQQGENRVITSPQLFEQLIREAQQ